MYIDFDEDNSNENRNEIFEWLSDENGFDQCAGLAGEILAGEQPETFDELHEQNQQELSDDAARYAIERTEAEEAKPSLEGSERIEYYTNSTGYPVNPEPNEHGIVLPDWALEKVEQCVSIFMGEQGWRVKRDNYHRGDLVSMTVTMLLDGRAKIEGADFLYHVRRAADYLLSPQFVGQETKDCTLFRKGGERAKAFKPIGTNPGSLHEVADLRLGGFSRSGTCGGNTGATIQVGSSIRNHFADQSGKMSMSEILADMPLPACSPNHHRQVEEAVFWADQMEVMTQEGNGEYAAILEMTANGWELKEIAEQFGFSVSTACRKRMKAFELWKELDSREKGTYRKRKKLQKFLNEVRARQLSEARAEHQIYLDGVKKREEQLKRKQSLIKSLRMVGLTRKRRVAKPNPTIPHCHMQTDQSFVGLN